MTRSGLERIAERVDRLEPTGRRRNEALPVPLAAFLEACERWMPEMSEFERHLVEVTGEGLVCAESKATGQTPPLPAEILVSHLGEVHENAIPVAARAVEAITRLGYPSDVGRPEWLVGLRTALATADPCALGILYGDMSMFPNDSMFFKREEETN